MMYWLTLGGSIFLFNRNVTRNFRKDGHNWRKRKDGKIVEESHTKLKVRIRILRGSLYYSIHKNKNKKTSKNFIYYYCNE